MISNLMLAELIRDGESAVLDFKESYPDNINKSIHDILCLLNSAGPGDRYIVFGIEDKTKRIVGIEKDPNKKIWQDDNLQDWVRNISFNRKPDIKFLEIPYERHSLGVLILMNRPDKPFYLLKNIDKAKMGIIYTRDGSTNTPTDKCANEVDIENMWRERFGIHLGSMDRLSMLMDDPRKWSSTGDKSIIHHIKHPEFHIKEEDDCRDFQDNFYRKKIKIPNLSKQSWFTDFKVFYFSTHIANLRLIFWDGGRIIFPMFEIDTSKKTDENHIKMYVQKNSLNFKFYKIYIKLHNISQSFRRLEDFPKSYTENEREFIFWQGVVKS